MSDPYSKRIKTEHEYAIKTSSEFMLQTAQPGMLDGLRGWAEAVSSAMDELVAAIDDADDHDAPDTYPGWAPGTLTIPDVTGA